MKGLVTGILGSAVSASFSFAVVLTVGLLIGNDAYAQLGRGLNGRDEKVFGPDDRIGVNASGSNIPSRFRPLLDGFGKIDPMGCTATHLGKGLVLTAGHCFDAGAALEKNVSCKGITITWGFRGSRTGILTSKCTNIIAMRQDEVAGVDFAVMQVDRVPSVTVALDFRSKLREGDQLTIFSHPADEGEQRPLQWSKYCKLFLKPVQNEISPLFAFHHCDTFGGSSGAAILSSVTGKIVAIHDGGWGDDPFSGARGYNYATRLENTPIQAIMNGTFR